MDSSIAAWRVADKAEVMALSPDGFILALGSGESDSILLYSVNYGVPNHEPLRASKYLTSVTFSPDGQMVACSSQDNVFVWNAATGQQLFSTGPHGEYIYDVIFSADSQLVISGSFDCEIRLWYASTGRPAAGSPINTKNKVASPPASPDGTKLAAGCVHGIIEVYSVGAWEELYTLKTDHTRPTILFSPDARYILSRGGKPFRVWDAETGYDTDISFNRDPKSTYRSFVFSPDGRYIALGADQAIEIWDVAARSLHKSFPHGHHGSGCNLAYFSNGRRLISGSPEDQIIKIWDVHQNGEDIGPLKLDSEVDATSITSLADLVSNLQLRGCSDLTGQLDVTKASEYPVSSGGFGDIYRCRLKSGIEVAVKTVRLYAGSSDQDKKYLKHAAQELYAWSKCKHVNIQPLLGMAMFRGQVGMIAEWESNGSVPEYLERHPDVDRCDMSTQIIDGLSYLHASGVVHGDLKGANVLVSIDGTPRLADFGNAKLQEYTLKFTKTSTKETMSSRWAAPELYEGAPCSFTTDVYALGMTVLETITGEVPWSGQTEHFVLFAVTLKRECPERPEAHIPTYSEHGDALWSVLRWCWENDPGKRPTAEQVKSKMENITKQGLRSIEVDMADVGTS
ncbi:Vegetative incompatibility protein HET-E-1 [Ceratobasidium sp. AG-Ba]|nr:Vegetative incompatibility protein HET-E-1 [Ceratobasidium sp. AG-Ba]